MIAEMTYIDWIGVLGSVMIAGAYLAVSRSWVHAEKPTFNLLNLVGALLILFSLYFEPVPGAILIEVFWIMIAGYALFSYFSKR